MTDKEVLNRTTKAAELIKELSQKKIVDLCKEYGLAHGDYVWGNNPKEKIIGAILRQEGLLSKSGGRPPKAEADRRRPLTISTYGNENEAWKNLAARKNTTLSELVRKLMNEKVIEEQTIVKQVVQEKVIGEKPIKEHIKDLHGMDSDIPF